MGQLRFVMPQRDRLPPCAAELAYLTGMEAVPFPSRNFWQGEQLVIEREVRESGSFHVMWDLPGYGPVLLATASLMERTRCYLLPVELARGTLNRLRNQAAQWLGMGLVAPNEYTVLEQTALRALAKAATHQGNPNLAAQAAEESLLASIKAIDLLSQAYVAQVLEIRHQQSPQLATLVGATLPQQVLTDAGTRVYQAAFSAASVPIVWREVEASEGEYNWTVCDRQFQWLKGKSLKVIAGPLLRLDAHSLPDWLYLWDDDFETIQGYIHHYITKVVERYRGQVQVWHCAAGLNLPGGLEISEEQKLRLAVLAVDTVRRADPRTPIVISFDQPWGEYLQREELDLPPYHFADALVRADIGVSGVGLEINLGYTPGGTLPRDVMELSRLVDRWSALGVPLLALLTSPSATTEDALARNKTMVLSPAATPAAQAAQISSWLAMLVAKQAIHGILWNQLAENEPHNWPHSGLFDAAGQRKPLLSTFVDLRKQHLA